MTVCYSQATYFHNPQGDSQNPSMSSAPDELDPDFGAMQFNGFDAWDCNVCSEFPHPPTYYFAVHVWASESGPSDAQRMRLRKLKQQYASLWPSIASTIVILHPTLAESNQVTCAMRDWVSVNLGEHSEDSIELVYDLNLPDEGTRWYFVNLTDDEVGEAFVAE